MSLDWSVGEIKDYKNVCYVPGSQPDKVRLSFVTECLIWGTMIVDLGGITKKNIDDWIRRVAVCKRLSKSFGSRRINGKYVDYYPSREELEAHIGLATNVGSRTFKQWCKRVFDDLILKVDFEIERSKEHTL